MSFASFSFLIFFTIVVTAVYFAKSEATKQRILLIASYIFYGSWNPYYLLLIAANSCWSWWLGRRMAQSQQLPVRRFYLWLGLALSLGMLGYFKYANFFIENSGKLLGLDYSGPLNILLPVGISFFTFHNMSYMIDLYRGRINHCESLEKFLLYVAFFPQLVAGPIVRAWQLLPQLEQPILITRANFFIGFQIFLGGFLQKLLIADNLAPYVDGLFAQPQLYSASSLWLGLLCYGVQIFCDFSGYSLMAIGCARVLGFTLPENFRMPYLSTSIAEFWRRWHMSLSFWMRDYLYISLGGNRHGEIRTHLNLAATMLLGGLWHGASWNFVLWGALHGIGLAVNRIWTARFGEAAGLAGQLVSWAITLTFVMLLWIPFRAQDFPTGWAYLRGMAGMSQGEFSGNVVWFHPVGVILLGITILWHAGWIGGVALLRDFPVRDPWRAAPATVIMAAIIAIALFAAAGGKPFIYFQF